MAKKILIISQYFYPEIGSGSNRMTNMFDLLIQRYEVDVLTTSPSYPNPKLYKQDHMWDNPNIYERKENINRISLRNNYNKSFINRLYLYLLIMYKFMLEIFKSKKQYDVVIVTSPPIFIGLAGVLAKWRFKATLCLDIRDLWPDSLKGVGVFNSPIIIKPMTLIEKYIYKRADKIIVNSKPFIERIKQKLPNQNTDFIYLPNGARKEELNKENAIPETKDSLRVIYAGNLGQAQNIDLLKNLAIKFEQNKLSLTVLGFGTNANDFENHIKNHGLKYVKLESIRSKQKSLELIKSHHIGLVTLNDQEIFNTVIPGKLLDYLTCGVPVVGAISGNARNLVVENQLGVVSEDRDANQIMESLVELNENPFKLQTYAKKTREFIKTRFLWEEHIKKLYKEIDNLN